MKILVTGADGFIGSHLTEALVRAGYEVRALALYNSMGSFGWLDHVDLQIRDATEMVLGDVRDMDSVRSAVKGCDAVCHLAALIAIPYSYAAPQSYIDVNVTGTANVMLASRDLGVARVLHTSTSEVYGTAQFVPITEAHPLNAQSPYAASKVAADQIALSYGRSFGTPVTVLRPFNTYGPRQSLRAVIPSIIVQLLDGVPSIKLGALNPTRDFNFVHDTVAAYLAALRVEQPHIDGMTINVGSEFEISIGDAAKTVASVVGCELRIERDERRMRPEASEVNRLLAGCALAREALGWRPLYGSHDGFRRGIERTIEFFRDPANRALYKNGHFAV